MTMGGLRGHLRALLGSVVLLLSVGFLVAMLSERAGDRAGVAAVAATVEEGLKHHPVLLGRGRSMGRLDLDLVYVSKRRVPNGADPIHNRRAGKSGRPPGRV